MARQAVVLSLAALTLSAASPLTPGAAVVLTIDSTPTPLQLTAADIAAMRHNSVSWTVHGKTLACAGPWLTDVLARAGVPAGEAVRGAALSRVVSAIGADGYRAVFTVGELDHMLGNAPVIVADQCDGHALTDADGPLRLVASTDKRGARSVKQLVRLSVVQLAAAPAP